MPLYDFYNTNTETVEEHKLPYSELKQFQEDNPHLQYRPAFARFGDPTRMGTYTNKLPKDFVNGILGKAKAAHPLGTIQT